MKRFTFISTLLASLPALLLGRRQPDDTFCPSGHKGQKHGMAAICTDPNDATGDILLPSYTIYGCGRCNVMYLVYTPTLQRRNNQPNANQ